MYLKPEKMKAILLKKNENPPILANSISAIVLKVLMFIHPKPGRGLLLGSWSKNMEFKVQRAYHPMQICNPEQFKLVRGWGLEAFIIKRMFKLFERYRTPTAWPIPRNHTKKTRQCLSCLPWAWFWDRCLLRTQ